MQRPVDPSQRVKMSERRDEDQEMGGQESKGKQGFASMPKDKVREIAAKGGRARRKNKGDEGDEQQGQENDDDLQELDQDEDEDEE